MGQIQLVRKLKSFIKQNRKIKLVFLLHFRTVFRQLRTCYNEITASRANFSQYFLQSIQFRDTVRSPETAKKAHN